MKSNTELTKLQNYLNHKKTNCLKEADRTLDDFKADLTEQIYNREDVFYIPFFLKLKLSRSKTFWINSPKILAILTVKKLTILSMLLLLMLALLWKKLKETDSKSMLMLISLITSLDFFLLGYVFIVFREAMESLRAATKAIAKKV